MGSLNDILGLFEENQRRKREHNAEFFRMLDTRRGMLFLGAVLLVIAIVIFLSAGPEKPAASDGDIVLDLSEMFADDPELRSLMESAAEDAARQAERARDQSLVGAFVLAVAAAACLLRAAAMKAQRPIPVSEDSGPVSAEESPCGTAEAPPSFDPCGREDRLDNLRRLYDAGILSREEYDERKGKLR